jgi:hypothetical protein
MKMKFRPPSGATFARRISREGLRTLLFERFKLDPGTVYRHTTNRTAQRAFARANRLHGRGYTKPRRGRGHTRGSGTTRRH